MALRTKNSLFSDASELLTKEGFSKMPDAATLLMNAAMLIQREQFLQAAPYERTEARTGYANGFKPKTVRTRLGELRLAVPQVRGSNFYPSALERGTRSERALTAAVAEMYVMGVSTRKVAAITEKLCGFQVSSAQVSNATKQLDEMLLAWRNRPLGRYRYLYLDARYERVRQDGIVVDNAVLIAAGVDESGRRDILGVSTSTSEAEVHWREFFKSLSERGLHGVELIISDDHFGLKAARKAVFPGIPWQRCQFHLQQNAQAYVPKIEMRNEVHADIRAIFDAPDRDSANAMIRRAVDKYRRAASKLSTWIEENIEQGLTVLNFPLAHRRYIRTTNMLERLNREIKRRTRVATMFPNADSCLRLVSAVLMEISEDWQTGRKYISVN